MKVRATAVGYYGDRRRRVGEVFELVERTVGSADKRRTATVEDQFSKRWMEKVEEHVPVSKTSLSADASKSKRKANVI